MTVIADFELVHPKARVKFAALREQLSAGYRAGRTKTKFEVFETYRSPLRQQILLGKGTTKAKEYESAHQFGLAVDFVPRVKVGERELWDWSKGHDWDFLRAAAHALGLKNDIAWDRAHVEHPIFEDVRKLLRWL